jgi:hypothetical protein
VSVIFHSFVRSRLADSFGGRGLLVNSYWGNDRDGGLGVSSARK